jgi:triosephosphate isomerase
MFKGAAEAGQYATELRLRLAGLEGVDVAVCPPYVSLAPVVEALRGSSIAVYAQNVHWDAEGAFTGEVSPPMLLEIGVHGALVSHSERRLLFGETDAAAALRAQAGLGAGMQVIACVGETEAEREAGETETVLRRQVEAIRDAVGANMRLTLAYEPVWAIGTGKNATPAEADEAHRHIRSRVRQWFGGTAAEACRILYGGSVKPENIRELIGLPDVDGALVGGASLEMRSFAEIITRAK